MNLFELLNFISNYKELLTIFIATVTGIVGLITLTKTILEYRLQGRQKRSDLFDALKNRLRTDKQLNNITIYLEDDSIDLKFIPKIDKYYFLGFYEQIAVAMNSGLIKENVAHYFFGYFALKCWESDNFWHLDQNEAIDKDAYYWATFKKFVTKMKEIEKRKSQPNLFQKLYDKLFFGKQYRF